MYSIDKAVMRSVKKKGHSKIITTDHLDIKNSVKEYCDYFMLINLNSYC